LSLDPACFARLDSWTPFLVSWIAAFTVLHCVRFVWMRREGAERRPHSTAITELAGLPLAMLQTDGFIRALIQHDPVSALLFAWWGPGFILSAIYYIRRKKQGVKATWGGLHLWISWLCKLNYLAFMIAFWALELPGPAFVYSVWIINDQIGLAFLSSDADRLRRTFHDYWFVRIGYPAGLLLPFVVPSLSSPWYRFDAAIMMALWLLGIRRVASTVGVMSMPQGSPLLRNMIYDKP